MLAAGRPLPTRARALASAVGAVILAAAGAAFTVLSTAGDGKLARIGVEVEGAPTMAWLAWLGAAGFARGGYLARDNTLAPPATASVVLVILIATALFCSVAAAAASGLAGPAVLAAAATAGWAVPLLAAHLFRRRRLYTAAGQQLLEGQAGASTNDMEGFAASTLTGGVCEEGGGGGDGSDSAAGRCSAGGGGCCCCASYTGLVLAFAASALLFSGMLTYASGATTSYYRHPPGQFAQLLVNVAGELKPQTIFYNCSGPVATVVQGRRRPTVFLDSDGSHGSPDFWPLQHALIARGQRGKGVCE